MDVLEVDRKKELRANWRATAALETLNSNWTTRRVAGSSALVRTIHDER
jgi:hypothetical protein